MTAMTTCRVKLRSGVKYIIKINCPTKASGGAHSIYTIPPGKPWEHSSGCPTMGTSPGQPETREAGRIRHRRWVPYKPQFNTGRRMSPLLSGSSCNTPCRPWLPSVVIDCRSSKVRSARQSGWETNESAFLW